MTKKIINTIVFILFFALFINQSVADSTTSSMEVNRKIWKVIWWDEFNYTGIPDTTKWNYQVGGHGWGNKELQYYTAMRPENARVEKGRLIIEARQESWENNTYTSARLTSRGKADWLYGRFEIRAKLPSGRGIWPALWMLPSQHKYGNGGWPDNGEIDIMESVGHNPGVVYATIHCNKYNHSIGTQKGAQINIPDLSTEFHTYSVEWYPNKIKAFVDDTVYFEFEDEGKGWESWPFDSPFYFVLNIAVGGSWGGQKGVDDSIFPQLMEIDYIRVYQLLK